MRFPFLITITAIALLSVRGYGQIISPFIPQDPTLVQERKLEITEIKATGLKHIRLEYIQTICGLSVGDVINSNGDKIAQSIQRINATGLFSNIKVYTQSTGVNKISVTYGVKEEPRLMNIFFERKGKRHSKRLKKKLTTLTPGYALTKRVVNQSLNTIKKWYYKKGYWGTEVSYYVKPVEGNVNRVNIHFEIDPGNRYEVKSLYFEGSKTFSQRRLKKAFKHIKQDNWWNFFSKASYSPDRMGKAKRKLINFYHNNGFLNAKVISDTAYVYNYKAGKKGIAVQVNVDEGIRYYIRNIKWEGNTLYNDEQLTIALNIKKGEVFNVSKLEKNLTYNRSGSDISSLYQDNGYLFFQVNPKYQFILGDSVDVVVEIYEGEPAVVSEVVFSGNSRTDDDVVRRSLYTIPGNVYSRSAIIRSVRELATIGYFDPENIRPDVEPHPEENEVVIKYDLKESKSTDNLELQGGYGGSYSGFIFSVKFNFGNFSTKQAFKKSGWNLVPSGAGQKVSLGVQFSGSSYRSYSFSFEEPWLNGYPQSLGVQFSYTQNNSYNLFTNRNSDYKRLHFLSSLGYRLRWPDDYFSHRISLSFTQYDVSQLSYLPDGKTQTLTLISAIERNSTDNFISPNFGSKFGLQVEVSPSLGLINIFQQFYKIKTYFQYHLSLAKKLTLSQYHEFGMIGFFHKRNRNEFGRFLVGGVRLEQNQNIIYETIELKAYEGQLSRVISPREEGEVIGGRIYMRYGLELRYPLTTGQQIQIIPYTFFEAGNSYADFHHFHPLNLKRSFGFGTRMFLPIIGLIDLSYGYRLDGVDGTDVLPGKWKFSFNIGAPLLMINILVI